MSTFTYIFSLSTPDSRVMPSWQSLPHQVLTPKSESELRQKQSMYKRLGGPELPEIVINMSIVPGISDNDDDKMPVCAVIIDYHFKKASGKRHTARFDNIEIILSLLDDANQGQLNNQQYPQLMQMSPGPSPRDATGGNVQLDPPTEFFYRDTCSDSVPVTAGLGPGHWKPGVVDSQYIWTRSEEGRLSQKPELECLSSTISHKSTRDQPLPETSRDKPPKSNNTASWILKNTSETKTLRFLRTALLIKSNLGMRFHMLMNIKAGVATQYQRGGLVQSYSGAGRLVGYHDKRDIFEIPGALEDLISFNGVPEAFDTGELDPIDHLRLRKVNLMKLTGVPEPEKEEFEEEKEEEGKEEEVQPSDHWNTKSLSLDAKVHKTISTLLQEPPPANRPPPPDQDNSRLAWENPAILTQFTTTLEDLQNVWGEGMSEDETEAKVYHKELAACKAMEEIINSGPTLDIGLDVPLFNQASHADKSMLTEVLEEQRERLQELTESLQGKDESTIKRELVNFAKTFNQELKDATRRFVLASPGMQSMDVVQKAEASETFVKCKLHLDAGVRRMIMKKMPNKFGSLKSERASRPSSPPKAGCPGPPTDPHQVNMSVSLGIWEVGFKKKTGDSGGSGTHQSRCPLCRHCFSCNAAGLSELARSGSEKRPSEREYRSGEYDESLAKNFIAFPGYLDDVHRVEPLIDTGGGVNIVSQKWLKKNKIPIPDTKETVQLQNADATISDPLPVIRMSWKFDDRDTIWTRVKFIVTKDGPDALLGLPFLKHTQVIHDSKGHLVFPEIVDIPSPSPLAGVYPIYHVTEKGPQKN